jgi:lipopolysaccharide biosynthesis regulator YciM
VQAKHYISIGVALVLLAVIYKWGNTNPPLPKDKPARPDMATAAAMQAPEARPEASFDSLLSVARREMPQHAMGELLEAERALSVAKDSPAMAPVFTSLAKIWQEHKQAPVAAYYYSLAAKLENSEKKLTFAAQLFLDLARQEHSPTVQSWEVNRAIENYDRVIGLNPQNDTARIGLAECYFGTGAAMKGVSVLREITNKDPEHIPANIMLGQQGLISGQYDKAQIRFETVLKKDPKNLEAMLGLAEAYKGQGHKDKAVELLEKCKLIINKPEFTKDVDNYIKNF